VKVETEYIASVQLSSGLATYTLDDVSAGSVDLADMGDLYKFYAFDSIEITLPTPGWGTASAIACYFVPTPTSTPATFYNIEARKVMLQGANTTVPQRMRWSSQDLHGQLAWYQTNAKASDPTFEQQGQFEFAGQVSSAEVIIFKVRAVCRFKTMLDPSIIAYSLKSRLASRPSKDNDLSDKAVITCKKKTKTLEESTQKCCGLSCTSAFCPWCGSKQE
jgi:hypothetical protein